MGVRTMLGENVGRSSITSVKLSPAPSRVRFCACICACEGRCAVGAGSV